MFKSLTLIIAFACTLFAQDDPIISIGLMDNKTMQRLSSISMYSGDTIQVKLQAKKASNPYLWVDAPGQWSLFEPDTASSLNPLPKVDTSTWTISPSKEFNGRLNVRYFDRTLGLPLIVLDARKAPPSKIVITPLTSPNSFYAGSFIKFLAHIENKVGVIPEEWSGHISIQEILTPSNATVSLISLNDISGFKGILSPVTFKAANQDTLSIALSTAGLYQYRIKVMTPFMAETLYDSTITLSILPSITSTQPVVSSVNPNIRVTTGRAGMVLDCLQPFSGQVFSLEGRTVARFTNVTSYNLPTQQMPTGKYILRASTGFGYELQRIITLFQ